MRQAGPVKKTPAKSSAPKNRIETPLAQTSYTPEKLFQKWIVLARELKITNCPSNLSFNLEIYILILNKDYD